MATYHVNAWVPRKHKKDKKGKFKSWMVEAKSIKKAFKKFMKKFPKAYDVSIYRETAKLLD